MVNSNQEFPGCNCGTLFEGRHCQYKAGTAPAGELLLYPPMGHEKISNGAIMAIVLGAVTFFGGMFVLIRQRKRQASRRSQLDESEDIKVENVVMDEATNAAPITSMPDNEII
jgi:hypothetical protein